MTPLPPSDSIKVKTVKWYKPVRKKITGEERPQMMRELSKTVGFRKC